MEHENQQTTAFLAKEMVDKPDHYGGTLTIDYIEALEDLPGNRMNFSRTSAIKYLSRAGMKCEDTEIQDLEKVIWYTKREIERIRRIENANNKSKL